MRIAYLHQYFNTPRMSGGTRSYEMAHRLAAGGHEVNMITSLRYGEGKGGWRQTCEEGINVHWIPISYSNKMPYHARVRAFLKFAINGAIRAASLESDVVFATSTPLTIALPGIYTARRQRIPMVFEVRDLWPELPIAVGALKHPLIKTLARYLERFAYQNSKRIVALSPGMKYGIVQSGYPAQHVTVIPNAADIELFDVPQAAGQAFRRRLKWLQDRPLVVYTGTLGLINGVDYLVRVAREVVEKVPEVRFLTVGDGAEEKRVRKLARKLEVLNHNFFMMSPLPKREMPAILSAADVATSFVIDLPELWSNSANKFFDALASGTPVAINYRGWQAELLEKSGAGIVLPVDDIPQAGQMLSSFLQAPDSVKAAATASRALAVEQFDRDNLAAKLEEVLLQAVQANS